MPKDDFLDLYLKCYDINKQIYLKETTHLPMEVNFKMKILEYTLTYSGGDVFSTRTDTETISQFDIVGVKAKLVNFPADNYAVRMYISSANYSNQNEQNPEDFQFSVYMIPQREDYNHFLSSINKTIGDTITVGNANTMPIMFSILNETDELTSNILNIELFKTNTSQTFSPNDLTGLFIKYNELEERLKELGGE